MKKHLTKYIISAVVILAACLWFIPSVPLVEEGISADSISVLHIEMGEESVTGHSAETYMDPATYTFSSEDEELQRILDILQQNTCRRTFRGLLGLSLLAGNGGSEYTIHITIADEEGSIINIVCDGEGGVLMDRTYQMNRRTQISMMEALRAIYE